jgi:protein involved in polysaccharide export with SLBB domain
MPLPLSFSVPMLRHSTLTFFTRIERPSLAVLVTICAMAQPFGLVASAQTTPYFPPSAPAVSTARYVVGPDDTLNITVTKHPEFSVAGVLVPQNGLISLPVVGTLRATGKTLEQLDQEITQGLKKRLRVPEVTVSLNKPRPRPVYIIGQVKTPGIYEAKNNWRVNQALAAAGGLSVDTDLAAVIINRNNQRILDAPLLPILRNPSSKSNLELKSGDTIRFYERKVSVSVTGAVLRPGIYSVPVGNGVAQAVGLSGGPTTGAALTRASIRRANGKTVPVNLYKAFIENDSASNLTLTEGDVIIVPEQKDRVSVLGAVTRPGFFPMEDGRQLKVSDAIALAGGSKENAALTRAVLRRSGNVELPINLYNLLVNGAQNENIVLRPDDTISIPEARGITVIGEVTQPGTYYLEEGKQPRVSDALASAGGLKIKPEQSKISVTRNGADGKLTSVSINAVRLLEQSNLTENQIIQDGDIVSVTAVKRSTIFVSGEVRTPGAYELAEGDGIAELVARAGGPTPDAALSQVSVSRRNGTVTTFNTATAIRVGGGRVGGALEDGDVVVIPRSTQRILVVGAVTTPGSYAMPEDRTLTIGDALSLAGGPQSNSRVKSITLLRSNGKEVTRTFLRIDREEKGVLSVNLPVLSGDVIYVPEGKPQRSTLDFITGFLPGAALLLDRN